jgi:hypothetical protein
MQDETIEIPQKYRTIDVIQAAAEQYFTSLSIRYKTQVDEEAAAKKAHKQDLNKHLSRRKTKQKRRYENWPVFRERHNIQDNLTHLIDIGYMSNEDEDPRNVPVEDWKERANSTCGVGQTALEVQRTLWRTDKVSVIGVSTK